MIPEGGRAPGLPSRILALLAGESINKVCVLLAFVWIARTLDPADYGDVEWAMGLLLLCTVAADAGLATWGAAELAIRPADAARLVSQVAWVRVCLAVPAYILLLGAAWSRGGSVVPAVAVFGGALFLAPAFLQYLFNGLFQTHLAALGLAARGAAFLTVVLLLVRPGGSPVGVAVAELTAAAALAMCSALLLRRRLGLRIRLSDGRPGSWSVLRRSWRIGVSELVWNVQWYAGLTLLGYMALSRDAAWFSAGLRIVMALHTGVWLYHYALLPNLAHLLAVDPAAWRRRVEESIRLTGWAGLAVPLAGMLAAETILRSVFGASFAEARGALSTVVWAIPLAGLSGHVRYSLIAARQPRLEYFAALVGAATTILVTFALIPALGSLGAAIGLLAGLAANGVAAFVLGRAALPDCSYLRPLLPCAGVFVACLSLGWYLSVQAGEIVAAAAATTAFGLAAIYAERTTVRVLVQRVAGPNVFWR